MKLYWLFRLGKYYNRAQIGLESFFFKLITTLAFVVVAVESRASPVAGKNLPAVQSLHSAFKYVSFGDRLSHSAHGEIQRCHGPSPATRCLSPLLPRGLPPLLHVPVSAHILFPPARVTELNLPSPLHPRVPLPRYPLPTVPDFHPHSVVPSHAKEDAPPHHHQIPLRKRPPVHGRDTRVGLALKFSQSMDLRGVWVRMKRELLRLCSR